MLWALGGSTRLRKATADELEDGANEVFVSSVSVWEAAIKIAAGKLTPGGDLRAALSDAQFEPLKLSHEHVFAAAALPMHHRDPFDRMLVAQAQVEGMTLVTTDSALGAYGVSVLPA